jgi:hypothetical protein
MDIDPPVIPADTENQDFSGINENPENQDLSVIPGNPENPIEFNSVHSEFSYKSVSKEISPNEVNSSNIISNTESLASIESSMEIDATLKLPEEHKINEELKADKESLASIESSMEIDATLKLPEEHKINEELKADELITESAEKILREKYNYYFDQNKELRHTETHEKFKFVNQAHYEHLGDIILKYVQEKMVSDYNMIEEFIPKDARPQCNIFISKGWFDDCKKALILIQGAGAVRAGIWARSVCINDSLITGSVFPFLDFAKTEGFEVIVLNPNYCYDPKTHERIPQNESLEAHGDFVWTNYISPCKAEDLYIVAHSCGGISTMSLINHFWEEFKNRVKGIAFTDAVHGYYGMGREKLKFLRRVAVDWIASSEPLDTPQRSYRDEVVYLSSGHHKHEYTTGSAYPSILKFILEIKSRNPYLKD